MPLRAEGEGKGRPFLGAVGFSLMMVLKVVPDFTPKPTGTVEFE